MSKTEETLGLLTTEQLEQILRTLVAEIRKPPVDPIKEIQAKRLHETKEAALKSYWEGVKRKKVECSHMRPAPASGGAPTSAIAWAKQSDDITRGVCPYCGSTFTPEDGDLYKKVMALPRGYQEAVRYM